MKRFFRLEQMMKAVRHLVIAVILLVVVGLSFSHSQTVYAQKKHNGLMLDMARHFYSVKVHKAYIDVVSAAGGGFVHLHVSDHENYALESRLLGQTAGEALFSDGLYRNRLTGRPFLSDRQLGEVVAYARQKGVELVPEVGSPNHMDAVFDLLSHHRGSAYVRALKSKMADDELDITNPQSIVFFQELAAEVMGKFPDSRRFHIGGDEFGYSEANNHEFVAYANRLAAFFAQKGWRMMMWNDGIIRANLRELDPKIEVTYWSYDGNPADTAEKRRRRALRVALPDLLDAGFKVWNYNSYYLYFVPKSNLASSGDGSFAAWDVKHNWHLGVWDGKNADNALRNPEKIQGAALAVWGEEAADLSDETIFRHTRDLLEAVLHKANVVPEP